MGQSSYSTHPKTRTFQQVCVTSCINLLQEADAWMRWHVLQQLVDDKQSVAGCQETCCNLIVKTCYPQACCKLFQQLVASLSTSDNRFDVQFNIRMHSHVACNSLLTTSLLSIDLLPS